MTLAKVASLLSEFLLFFFLSFRISLFPELMVCFRFFSFSIFFFAYFFTLKPGVFCDASVTQTCFKCQTSPSTSICLLPTSLSHTALPVYLPLWFSVFFPSGSSVFRGNFLTFTYFQLTLGKVCLGVEPRSSLDDPSICCKQLLCSWFFPTSA